MDELIKKCFMIHSIIGDAKSEYYQALRYAKRFEFEKSKSFIRKGDDIFVSVFDLQTQLVQGHKDIDMTKIFLLTHTQDQIMSVESFKLLAQEMIECYEHIHSLTSQKEEEV